MDRNPAKTTCTITPLLRSYLRLCYFLGVDSTKYERGLLQKALFLMGPKSLKRCSRPRTFTFNSMAMAFWRSFRAG